MEAENIDAVSRLVTVAGQVLSELGFWPVVTICILVFVLLVAWKLFVDYRGHQGCRDAQKSLQLINEQLLKQNAQLHEKILDKWGVTEETIKKLYDGDRDARQRDDELKSLRNRNKSKRQK